MIAHSLRTPAALFAALLVHLAVLWGAGRPAPPPRFELSDFRGIEIALAPGRAAPEPVEEPAPPPPPVVERPKPKPAARPKPETATAKPPVEKVPSVVAAPTESTPSEAAAVDSDRATDRTAASVAPRRGAGERREPVAGAYLARLHSWLERHKRYPTAARMQRLEGIVELRFVMDRRGNVLSSDVERSSGHPLLDQEVLAMLRRATPLPVIPDEMTHERLELVLPVAFQLH